MALDRNVSDCEVVSCLFTPPLHPLAVSLDVCLVGSFWLHVNALCRVLIRTNPEFFPSASAQRGNTRSFDVAFFSSYCVSSSNASDVANAPCKCIALPDVPLHRTFLAKQIDCCFEVETSGALVCFFKLVFVCLHVCVCVCLYQEHSEYANIDVQPLQHCYPDFWKINLH